MSEDNSSGFPSSQRGKWKRQAVEVIDQTGNEQIADMIQT